MDELKKYFQQHRGQLDTDVPAEGNWQTIRRRLRPRPVISFLVRKWIVAAGLVLLTGTSVYLLVKKENRTSPVITTIDSVYRPPHQEIIPAKPQDEKLIVPEKQQPLIARQKAGPVNAIKRIARKARVKRTPTPVYGFEEIEASYTSMVNLQLERVRTQPIYAEDAAYFHAFKKQFTDLANDEEQVKARIRQTGMADNYVDELINIYQEKIGVLKRLRFEINKMNNRVRQADPAMQQQQPSYINL